MITWSFRVPEAVAESAAPGAAAVLSSRSPFAAKKCSLLDDPAQNGDLDRRVEQTRHRGDFPPARRAVAKRSTSRRMREMALPGQGDLVVRSITGHLRGRFRRPSGGQGISRQPARHGKLHMQRPRKTGRHAAGRTRRGAARRVKGSRRSTISTRLSDRGPEGAMATDTAEFRNRTTISRPTHWRSSTSSSPSKSRAALSRSGGAAPARAPQHRRGCRPPLPPPRRWPHNRAGCRC